MLWGKKKRRAQARQRPFPPAWLAVLERRVPYYACLSIPEQLALQGHIQVFLSEKNFEGCGGLELSDEILVTVAGYACILILNQDTDYYPRLDTVLVYPTAFVMETTLDGFGELEVHGEEIHSGEAWQQGVVILAWEDIEHGGQREHPGFNVIVHEFAHQLDMENGEGDGFPLLVDTELRKRWPEVFRREYNLLVDNVDSGRATLLDPYGAESPAEFFAVVTEAFFGLPVEMARAHPELYTLLSRFYEQNPADKIRRLREPTQDG